MGLDAALRNTRQAEDRILISPRAEDQYVYVSAKRISLVIATDCVVGCIDLVNK